MDGEHPHPTLDARLTTAEQEIEKLKLHESEGIPGPQGEQGPPGPEGPMGPRGDPGPPGTGLSIYPVLYPGCSQSQINAAKSNPIILLTPGTYWGDFSGETRFVGAGAGKTTIYSSLTSLTGDGDISEVEYKGTLKQVAAGQYMENRRFFEGLFIQGDLIIDYSGGVIQGCLYPWLTIFHGDWTIKGTKSGSRTWFNGNHIGFFRSWDAVHMLRTIPSSGAEASDNVIERLTAQPTSRTKYFAYLGGPGTLNEIWKLTCWDVASAAPNLVCRVYFDSGATNNTVKGNFLTKPENLAKAFGDAGGRGSTICKGHWWTGQNNQVIDLAP